MDKEYKCFMMENWQNKNILFYLPQSNLKVHHFQSRTPHTQTVVAAYRKKYYNMETNEQLRKQIFEIIKNQLRDNDPPETKQTYQRLQAEGFDEFQTKQMIGQCLSVELFAVLKHGEPYDNERYIQNLLALPKKPFN